MLTERALTRWRTQISAVKELKGWTNKDLAKYLGVSERTVYNMKKSPTSVDGGLILAVQELLDYEQTNQLNGHLLVP